MLSEIEDRKTELKREYYTLFHENDQHLNKAEEALKKCRELTSELAELERWAKGMSQKLVDIEYEAWMEELSKPDYI